MLLSRGEISILYRGKWITLFVWLLLQLAREWEDTPPHFTRLDVTPLVSDSNIDEVCFLKFYYLLETRKVFRHSNTRTALVVHTASLSFLTPVKNLSQALA